MKNAKITSASLGLDNGTLTARIYVMGDSFGGSFYVVGLAESWITGVLNCAGVDAWEDLTGEMIRVEDPVCGSTIERITHITDDEIYFDVNDIRSHDDWIARQPTDAKEWMAGPGAAAARARAANGVKLPRPKLSRADRELEFHDHLSNFVHPFGYTLGEARAQRTTTTSQMLEAVKDYVENSGLFDRETQTQFRDIKWSEIEEALSHDDVQDASSVAHDHARGLRRTQFEAPTKIEAVKAVKDSAEASGLFDPETPASEVQPKLGDLTLGVAKTRRQNLWAGDLRDTDSFTVGFWDGRLWALARLAPILSASQRTQAKELLGITESEWSEVPEPGFKPLSRDDLVDTCWTIAVDGSESSTMRAKAIDTLVELVAR